MTLPERSASQSGTAKHWLVWRATEQPLVLTVAACSAGSDSYRAQRPRLPSKASHHRSLRVPLIMADASTGKKKALANFFSKKPK